VKVFDASVQRLVDQLFETMYAIEIGVGLAATQIGRTDAVFVFDCRDGLIGHVVNPVVERIGLDIQDGEEGCLSLPGLGAPTVRFEACRVRGQTAKGDDIVFEGTGLRSRCFQHETDHLNGKLYIDHLNPEVRQEIEEEMRASEWFGKDSLDPKSKLYRQAQGE
jgi:peptide deformylase